MMLAQKSYIKEDLNQAAYNGCLLCKCTGVQNHYEEFSLTPHTKLSTSKTGTAHHRLMLVTFRPAFFLLETTDSRSHGVTGPRPSARTA